ncbi:MAG TPA: phosphoenolpyruvate--protein phosphotransferase [Thermoanaerobaculia bacterium]|nr:phosphoenolpyruvate--protein phosphotransferase [Thermoanaerobaculia bacterium]
MSGERTYQGRVVTDGVAIGPIVVLKRREGEILRMPLPADGIDAEIDRFRAAVATTRAEIERTQDRVEELVGSELAGIFDAHGLILGDRMFTEEVEQRIRDERVNAEWAVHETSQRIEEQFASIETEHLRERGEDMRDVTRYLMRALQGIAHHELAELGAGHIVVTDELTPSEALRLGRQGVAGMALEAGGPNSHTTIVARALKVPLVVGLGPISDSLSDNEPAILDAASGRLLVQPDREATASFRGMVDRARAQERVRSASRALPARTRDGVEIELHANVEFPEELEDAVRYGAQGIGLYRSEFLYIERSPELPSEEEHLELFRRMLEAMTPCPVVVRTFDLGGKKLARQILAREEENPSLGLRGIRLTLTRPDIFRSQLRALYRASVHGRLEIMIPMVSGLDEVRLFRALCAEVMAELRREGHAFDPEVPLGAMIEVPSAALMAGRLAQELEFLSIGTNDLIQYTLAVDRNNDRVAGLYQPLHPAILDLIGRIVEGVGERARLSLCGEMAANPLWSPLLIGAGLRRLSMAPALIPDVKHRIRRLDLASCVQLFAASTKFCTAGEVERALGKVIAESDLPVAGVSGPAE